MTSALLWAAPVHDVDGPVQVFVLSGQSNTKSQAVFGLAGRDYHNGKGPLAALPKAPKRISSI